MLIITSSLVDVFVFVYAWRELLVNLNVYQASLDIEDCENKVEGVGQQELSMQGVCLCVFTLKSIVL